MRIVNLKNFESDVLNSSKPCIVKFGNEMCHLCVALGPVYEEVEKEYKNINFFEVNIDQEEALGETFSSEGIPTIYLFTQHDVVEFPDPEEPDKESWFSKEHIKNYIKKYLKA
jgi:thioredoxin 1